MMMMMMMIEALNEAKSSNCL
uniref:Family with sequence similarity 13, member B n=1 Tax=Nothobranchius furzeri TaxID=105023 RepID=A0A1A7ZTX4_NOTFU